MWVPWNQCSLLCGGTQLVAWTLEWGKRVDGWAVEATINIRSGCTKAEDTMYKYFITCRIEQFKLIDVHDRLGVIKRKKKTRRGKRAGGKKKTVSIRSKCTIIINFLMHYLLRIKSTSTHRHYLCIHSHYHN